jgi:hypothetical protein
MKFSKSPEYRELIDVIKKIKLKYKLSDADFFTDLQEEEVIPVSIFSKNLAPLETIVKYLKENRNYTLSKISRFLARSEKTIWQAYNSSLGKKKEAFTDFDFKYIVPLSAISDRKYTVFELLILYLVEQYHLKYSEVADLLKRDDRTVWVVYHRATKKRGDKK